MTDQQWTDKHAPTSLDDIQGNTSAIERITDWAEAFPADRTPRLLEGPPGVGKTTTAERLADHLGLDLVEVNASSHRDADAVREMASLIRSTTADGERRVVLLDEVDSWHHATDRRPLYDALDNPANVVLCTCNDTWETPDAITNRCETEEFKLNVRSRRARLRQIAEAESLDLADDVIDTLAERPDLRSAINDLQVYGESGVVPGDDRDWASSEWDMVDAMLTGTPALGDRPRDGIRPGEAVLWLDENIKHEYRGLELAWAYEALARADTVLMQDAVLAQAIVEQVAALRLTEPYFDDHLGRSKEFPEWFKHSTPDAAGESSEARLYRALKGYDDGSFAFFGNYDQFRRTILPDLRDLDLERRCELILTHGLAPDEYDALGVTEAQFESYVETEEPREGDGLERTKSATEW